MKIFLTFLILSSQTFAQDSEHTSYPEAVIKKCSVIKDIDERVNCRNEAVKTQNRRPIKYELEKDLLNDSERAESAEKFRQQQVQRKASEEGTIKKCSTVKDIDDRIKCRNEGRFTNGRKNDDDSFLLNDSERAERVEKDKKLAATRKQADGATFKFKNRRVDNDVTEENQEESEFQEYVNTYVQMCNKMKKGDNLKCTGKVSFRKNKHSNEFVTVDMDVINAKNSNAISDKRIKVLDKEEIKSAIVQKNAVSK